MMTRVLSVRAAVAMSVVAAALASALTACAADDTATSATSADAAIPPAGDADRYLPRSVQGYRVGKLTPTHNAELSAHAEEYGVAGWLEAYTGATVGRNRLPYGFVGIAHGSDADPDRALQTVLFSTGSGEIVDVATSTLSGEEVTTGTVSVEGAPFEFALWHPRPDVTVSVAVGVSGDRLGVDAAGAMEEIIAFTSNDTVR